MASIFQLTLRQLAGRWRIAIMTILASMPVIIASIMVASNDAPTVGAFEVAVLSAMLAGSITPLIVLAIASAAFANEVDDRTLANLTLSTLPRWQIAVPKLLASFALAAPFIAASALVTSYIAYMGDMRAILAVTAGSLAAVALYAAAFVWLGLVTTQAIGVGLLYIVVWEGFFSGFVEGVRLLSIRHYAIALIHTLDERRFAAVQHLNPVAAVAVCTAVFVAFLYFTIRRLQRMDVP